jgi:hypothetical protein
MGKAAHSWTFFRAGGVDQVVLKTADDIANLASLDQKLWVALACPVQGIHIEARTLHLLDADADGRIRPPDVLAAVSWLNDVMRDLGDLYKASDEVPLDSISTDSAAGKEVLAGAKLILKNLGKESAQTITLADVSSTESIFSATKLNGDGIVPPESCDVEATRQAIADVITVMGSATDRSGKPGVDQARVDAFFDQVKAYADWFAGGASTKIAGDATAAAADALNAVRTKVDDYFSRCRLAAFDPRAAAALNPSDADLAALGPRLLSTQSEDVAKLPLARVEAARALPLAEGINPAWTARLADFGRVAVTPLLGGSRTSLTDRDWDTITTKMAAYDAWQASKPAVAALQLGHDRLAILAAGSARTEITDLITRDAALAAESNQIEAVEKLIRCRRDFVVLLKNFVSFAEFYGTRRGVFQAGTLYVDGRSCDLCMPVDDPARHALLASLSQAYLVYCDCVRKADKIKRSIVAAVTGGDTDNLMVGRNGVFYDREGNDWDATITKIVENPISVRQAFWAPYKRLIRLVQEQVAKRASAADADSRKQVESAALATAASADHRPGTAGKEPAPAPPAADKAAPPSKGIDVGTVAAIGVAVGGLATFLSSILAIFFGLGMWMPIGLLALVLAISGPSMLIAWLKLRQRNIGPILDANGWAVNALARINVPFGGALTSLAALPPGAARSLRDPFAERKRPWKLYFFLLLLLGLGIAWVFGKLDSFLPEEARSAAVLERMHPTPSPPAFAKPPPAEK